MVRQSGTLFGIISNLKDLWTEFLLLIAESGIFDVVKEDLKLLLAKVKELSENGDLQRWAEEISDRLVEAWEWGKKFVESGQWDAVVEDLKEIAKAAQLVAEAILAIAENWEKVSVLQGIGDPLGLPGEIISRVYGDLTGSGEKDTTSSAGGSFGARGARSLSLAPQSVEVGGKATVEILPAPGWFARTVSLSPGRSQVPYEVRTGRTMRGAA